MGKTDAGLPLHLIVYNTDGKTQLNSIKNSKKNRVLINNGIHPGESDGIDASMLLLRDIVQNDSLKNKYQNTIISVIPIYNIGGSLNRNSHSRANQNGPKEYGFRGNARNFDLNRDFVKQDGSLGKFIETQMRPALESSMAIKNMPITPYVNVWGKTPKEGWSQFYDSPRYSTGYSTLFNTLGMMVETHMLKPYDVRVNQTYELMFSVLDFIGDRSSDIKRVRKNAIHEILKKKTYPITFEINSKKEPSMIQFRGFEGEKIPSKVTNGKRLFYDKAKPYIEPVEYVNEFRPKKEIIIPKAYILKKGWHRVLDRLQNNNIEYSQFKSDTTFVVETLHVADYKTRKTAYEGHYLHYSTRIKKEFSSVTFSEGDIYIPTNQKGVRYVFETLEPEATDSFFNWNFFDTVLQQKEGYSSYVFEDVAEQILKENPSLNSIFKDKMITDKEFSKNSRAQLDFIYKRSLYYEKAHLLLPVYKGIIFLNLYPSIK